MTSPNQVIENPLSGERITIIEHPRVTGDALVWELVLAPGGRVPNSHSHPEQEERFTVCDGMLRFRIGWRRRLARPGDVVVVPRGTVHHFAEPGHDSCARSGGKRAGTGHRSDAGHGGGACP